MQTGAPRPAARYRNDRVFRSAELLVASQPTKTAEQNPARWLVFALGLALGAGLVTFLPRLWRDREKPVSPTTTEAPSHLRVLAARTPVAPPTPMPAPAPAGAATPVSAVAPADSAAPQPTEPDALIAAANPPPDRFSRAAAVSAAMARRPFGEPLGGHFAGELTLRGELLFPNTPPVPVEFALIRPDVYGRGFVRGHVRFLRGNERIAAFVVEGTFTGLSIKLSEIEVSWYRGQPPAVGRRFEITLPSDSSQVATGTWTFGGASGTLSLRTAPPW